MLNGLLPSKALFYWNNGNVEEFVISIINLVLFVAMCVYITQIGTAGHRYFNFYRSR